MQSLPIVHLSVLRPFVTELQARGVDPDTVLQGLGLSQDVVMDDDAAVHVMVIHQFLENAAAAVADPLLAASVGARLDTTGWPFLEKAVSRAATVGDFLSIYISETSTVASSVESFLEIRNEFAVFGERRLFQPSIRPAQNDAFMAALAYSVLQRLLGAWLKPGAVRVVVSDPAALADALKGVQCLRGDNLGFKMHFPSKWLALRLNEGGAAETNGVSQGDGDVGFLHGFRKLLLQRVGKGKLSADEAAALVQLGNSQLARRLKRYGTDISTEIAEASMAYAKAQLRESTRPIGEIADALGFTDASNFTRAFRKHEGLTPSQYRHKPDMAVKCPLGDPDSVLRR